MRDLSSKLLGARRTRREFFQDVAKTSLGLSIASSALSALACSPVAIRLGILEGTQTLWRYLALKREELLQPLGYQATFINYRTETELQEAFLKNQIDVIATLPTTLPNLAQSAGEVQFFLPIAWLTEGFPLVVRNESPVQSPADLEGKRVSVFPLSHPGLAFWRAFVLENYGFRLEERWVLDEQVSPEVGLLQGTSEGAIVASPAWSGLRASGELRVVSNLAREWEKLSPGSLPLIFGGYIARKGWLNVRRGFVQDFIRLHAEALSRYKSERSTFVEAVSQKASNLPELDAATNEAIASYLGYDVVPPERVYISEQDVHDYDRVFGLLTKAGLFRSQPPPTARLFLLSSPKRSSGLVLH